MDAERFDALTRTLGCTTRRRTLRLLAAGTLGGIVALLGHAPAEASHGCHHVGKPCTRSSQCCTGARCQSGTCKCKAIYFKCGTICCLDGATCFPLFGGQVCLPGLKAPGDRCDPTLPGQCASGKCTCFVADPPNGCICREADCAATQGLCTDGADCCRGSCIAASSTCGGSNGSKRCCFVLGEVCVEDCDCCNSPNHACQGGTCCVDLSGFCVIDAECCGDLVCSNQHCAQP